MIKMIVVDVGSTTTKALFFEQTANVWRYRERGEAATTVEAPNEDVMIGVLQAITVLEERMNLKLIEQDGSILIDGFLATSSAGGGLQIVVCGNVGQLSAESARRAALGGGAVLLNVFSSDDGQTLFQRLDKLRTLRPDMILISGGIDGASMVNFVVEMCDFIRTGKPKPKFGTTNTLPIIYAGASSGIPIVKDLLGEGFEVRIVDNLRPSFAKENLDPTRNAIHELFIEHVMANAPGYTQLLKSVTLPILPTPTAVGEILTKYSVKRKLNLLCVDIGGATTDIFTVVNGNFVRSVSANYGMSYSIGNVVATAGGDNILRWLPENQRAKGIADLLNRLGNKLLNPISIPATLDDLRAEQATAREAMRLSLDDHLAIAKIQKGVDIFTPNLLQKNASIAVEMIDLIIGSGGVLSNAPRRGEAAVMLLDAFQPVGQTELMVDSVFMLPHLGAFARMDEQSALRVLEEDCLVSLGTALTPQGNVQAGSLGIKISGITSNGKPIAGEATGGSLVSLPLGKDETADITISTHNGAHWPGSNRVTVRGGVVGLILDLRGRPLNVDTDKKTGYAMEWLEQLCHSEEEDKQNV